jgi:hypothetical protein
MANLEQPYLTRDLYLTSYLCLKGMTLLKATDTEPRNFVLVDSEDRDAFVEEWITGTGDARIAKHYAAKMRLAKKVLYDN